MLKHPNPGWRTLLFAASLASATPAMANEGLVCLAATRPADAGKPLAAIDSLEFYADEGNPALSYSFPLTLLHSAIDEKGRTLNTYSVRNETEAGAVIVFAGETPLSIAVDELKRTFDTLARNDEETEFMADAVPGIACYSAAIERQPP